MSTSLKDLDVTNEIFYEALEKGRNARDINRIVYERLLAMEDFEHFKKMMVKRNIELQLEELQEYRAMQGTPCLGQVNTCGLDNCIIRTLGYTELDFLGSTASRDGALPDPDELEQRILGDLNNLSKTATDDEVKAQHGKET